MRIVIGNDHIVTEFKNTIKEHLLSLGHEVIDVGTFDKVRTHYPIFGYKIAQTVINKQADLGIAICGTGVGISNAANKVKGIRCALVRDVYSAIQSRRNLDANVIAIGGRITGTGLALEIIDNFLTTKYRATIKNQKLIIRINNLINKTLPLGKNPFSQEITSWEKGKYTNGVVQAKNRYW